MKTAGFWGRNRFFGLVVVVGLLLFTALAAHVQRLVRTAYDIGLRLTDRQPSDRIAVLAIDNPSIRNIGRFPWPRDVHAEVVDQPAGAKAPKGRDLAWHPNPDALLPVGTARLPTGDNLALALRARVAGAARARADAAITL